MFVDQHTRKVCMFLSIHFVKCSISRSPAFVRHRVLVLRGRDLVFGLYAPSVVKVAGFRKDFFQI